jgi:PAS domain S-box-containing protein
MWSNLFEAVPDALIVVDRVGVITHANQHAERLFGYAPRALLGLPIEALMPEEVRQRHHGHRADYVASPRVRPMGAASQALIGLRLDGQRFPIEIALSPIHVDGNEYFLASIRDVSESLRVRQALTRARYDAVIARIGQLALEARDEAGVFSQLPALLAEALSVESIVIAMLRSDSARVDVRASIGLRDDWPDPELWLDGQHWPSKIALAGGEAIISAAGGFSEFAGIESAAFLPLQDRDRPMGALIALASASQRFDHDAMHLLQSTAHILAAFVQRRRTEDQLAHAQRLDAIGQLTGGIAHDFNNLLTVISGSLQLLEFECGEQAEVSSLIASASRSVARGAELTGKLLAFARRQRLTPAALTLSELLQDLEVMLRRTLGDSIQLKIHCAGDVPPVFADAAQLDTALVNLALNARDAMPRGGNIEISARALEISEDDELARDLSPGAFVAVAVADTGHGMTSEVMARALDPFFTTKEMGRGSGLGLSMVYGFVKQSGGHLRIDSQLGYGTRVELYLPAAAGASVAVEAAMPSDVLGGNETILVVEDEADVRNIAAAFLHSLGYHVRRASNAREALERLAEDDTIELVFTDVMLGDGLTGVELAHSARRRYPDLAVLLTSGYAQAQGAPAVDSTGFELLRKPYRREQLAAAIRRQLAL